MRKFVKRFLVFILTFTISFNVVSSQYQCSKINASATAIGLSEVVSAVAAALGVNLGGALALAGGALTTYVTDSFVSYVTGVDSSELDVYDRLGAGVTVGVGVTAGIVNDVRGWLDSIGIDAKSGTVAEKTVSISSGDFTWFYEDKFVVGNVWVNNSGTYCYFNNECFWNITPAKFTLATAKTSDTAFRFYLITDTKLTSGQVGSGQREARGYTLNDAKTYFYDKYVVDASGWTGSSASLVSQYYPSFVAGDYYVYNRSYFNPSYVSEDYISNVDISKAVSFETENDLKAALKGNTGSSVDLTIPSIGVYDDANITDLTDGRTLSAADLKALTDALANQYADYKNSDGAITQEDLQNAVTAAIAAALAAAGEKEEPENPSIPDVDFSGIFDWLDKIYKALTTFFATATSFVTTFPLQRWKESLETFPSITQQITDAIGDIFLTDKSIAETLITFPTAEKLAEWFEGFPTTLANIYDAVTIFPKAIQDGMTDVIQDVFPAALIDALQDALPAIIGAGVASLPLTLVDILIPQLDLSIPKAINGTLPSILQDALKEGIKIPDLKVEFPSLDIPNYMDILAQILAAILSIPSLLTLDVPLIKSAVQSATKDVALETGVEPILALFESIKFSDDYTYPVISVKTPDILKPYYQQPEIILCDFEKYAEYCLWARNIFRVTLWLAFLYWAAKQLQVKYHIA